MTAVEKAIKDRVEKTKKRLDRINTLLEFNVHDEIVKINVRVKELFDSAAKMSQESFKVKLDKLNVEKEEQIETFKGIYVCQLIEERVALERELTDLGEKPIPEGTIANV